MKELLSSQSFWVFFFLCAFTQSMAYCKQVNDKEFHGIMLMETFFYTLYNCIGTLISIISIVVLSVKGEWWYCFILLATLLIIAPLAMMIVLQPVTKILGNIVTNIQANHRTFIDIDSARAGCGVSIWMMINLIALPIFEVWMIVLYFA